MCQGPVVLDLNMEKGTDLNMENRYKRQNQSGYLKVIFPVKETGIGSNGDISWLASSHLG